MGGRVDHGGNEVRVRETADRRAQVGGGLGGIDPDTDVLGRVGA